jgi:hypothetical protein
MDGSHATGARGIEIDNSDQTTAGRGSRDADVIHSKLACANDRDPNYFVQNSKTLSL